MFIVVKLISVLLDPVHCLTRKLLRNYLLVKKLQMAVVAVTVVQPPLIRTVTASFCVVFISGNKSPMHGIWSLHRPPRCKLCGIVISFSFQLVFKATS